MTKVNTPHEINQAFANAFNSRNIDNFKVLYEDNALLRIDSETTFVGVNQIMDELQKLLTLPGKMTSLNNFCIVFEDIALLRADHTIIDSDGNTIMSGSSAEVVRRQPDDSWLYIIDHAMGATLPRIGR